MVPFQILNVVEYMDGSVFVEYETVADDGNPLVEGDTFTPDEDTDLEEAITEWLTEKRQHREAINVRVAAEQAIPAPRMRQSTRKLSDAAMVRVQARVSKG